MLKIGQHIPEFTLQNQDGQTVSSQSLVGDKVLILYFYPKDFTPGCTREACSFRDNSEDFLKEGARVVGISSDSVKTHKKFSQRLGLKYPLLSDSEKLVHHRFEIPSNFFGLLSGRVTFVIDTKGIIREVFASQFQPLKHVSKALEVVRELEASAPSSGQSV